VGGGGANRGTCPGNLCQGAPNYQKLSGYIQINNLRSSANQDRLNHVSIISIENQVRL